MGATSPETFHLFHGEIQRKQKEIKKNTAYFWLGTQCDSMRGYSTLEILEENPSFTKTSGVLFPSRKTNSWSLEMYP